MSLCTGGLRKILEGFADETAIAVGRAGTVFVQVDGRWHAVDTLRDRDEVDATDRWAAESRAEGRGGDRV